LDKVVPSSEIEHILLWLGLLELVNVVSQHTFSSHSRIMKTYFHDVRRSRLSEVVLILELPHVKGILSLAGTWDISCGTEPELAGLLCGIVQAESLVGGSGKECCSWSGWACCCLSLSWVWYSQD
jgi:hypothetical protein